MKYQNLSSKKDSSSNSSSSQKEDAHSIAVMILHLCNYYSHFNYNLTFIEYKKINLYMNSINGFSKNFLFSIKTIN